MSTLVRDAVTVARPTTAPRTAARVAGVSYLVMFVLALAANAAVSSAVDRTDPAATLAGIAGSGTAFRLGAAGFLVIAVLDIVIAWGLHVVLRRVDPDLSRAAAWFRLAYSAVLVVAVAALLRGVQLADGTWSTGSDPAGAVQGAVADFHATWSIGLAVFGVHLVLVGLLVLRAGWAPRVLGILLVVAGAAYAADTVARLVLPDYDVVATALLVVVAVPSILAEVWLGGWLLVSRRLGRATGEAALSA